MTDIKPRRKRATGIRFPSVAPGYVVCPHCTLAQQERNAALPRLLRRRVVYPYGVPRKYLVSHMRQVHGMVVVAPEAMPQEMVPPKRSLLDVIRSIFPRS